jgi:hypothetical protein
MSVVGYLVGDIRNLGLKGGAWMGSQTRMVKGAVVFPQSLQHFVGEVETRLLGIALLEHLDDPQALPVMIESPVIFHQAVERLLSRVAEGGVPEVMGKGDRLGQVLVEAQGAGNGTTD